MLKIMVSSSTLSYITGIYELYIFNSEYIHYKELIAIALIWSEIWKLSPY